MSTCSLAPLAGKGGLKASPAVLWLVSCSAPAQSIIGEPGDALTSRINLNDRATRKKLLFDLWLMNRYLPWQLHLTPPHTAQRCCVARDMPSLKSGHERFHNGVLCERRESFWFSALALPPADVVNSLLREPNSERGEHRCRIAPATNARRHSVKTRAALT